MQNIYLFNPDNDLALAHGGGHYVAPPFAQKMQHDLCTLPMWYASKGSKVVVENEEMVHWVASTSTQFNLGIEGITPNELNNTSPDSQFMPWGWSGTIKRRLIKKGVDASLLPTDKRLAKIMQLAHRKTSIIVHEKISQLLGRRCSPIPQIFNKISDVINFAAEHKGCFVKMPYSGSGQGIFCALRPESTDFENWCKGALKRQGELICEVGLNKKMDFALEFQCKSGNVDFLGYSVFESDAHSQYSTGLVTSPTILEQKIAENYIEINQIKETIAMVIADIYATHYEGFLGVDMLLYDDGNGHIDIDPCVEVNLRATMGVVTCEIGKRIMKKETSGIFRIEYEKNGFPTKDQENRLYLTPILTDTQYCAYIDFD